MIDKDQIIEAQQEKIERIEQLQEDLHNEAIKQNMTEDDEEEE